MFRGFFEAFDTVSHEHLIASPVGLHLQCLCTYENRRWQTTFTQTGERCADRQDRMLRSEDARVLTIGWSIGRENVLEDVYRR